MLPAPGELLHFSEDPTLTRFVPHVAPTAQQPQAYVWTVDALNAPCYWFPRQCPRVCAWDAATGGSRVHAVEDAWFETVRATTVWAYRFDAADFEPFGERPHAHVATHPVEPLGPPVPVDDLVGLHAAHGIELLVLPELEPWFAGVRARGLEFSGIRLRNAGIGPEGPFPVDR